MLARRKAARVAVALATLATSVCLARPAAAWCRTTTCDPTAEPCEVQDGCIVTGYPVFWGSRCVSFDVQQDGSPLRGIPYEVAMQVISDGYFTWMGADCGGGVPPLIEIATHNGAICDEHVYNPVGPNANVWMFRDEEWPYDGVPGAAFALTTLTFSLETGEIFDADVQINSVQNELSLDATTVTNDLPSIVAHEVGHFLGLSHSSVQEATMFATYADGSTELRTLAADDMAAICMAYPPDRQPWTDSCEPRDGFVSECASTEPPPEPPPEPDPPPANGSGGSTNASDGSEGKPVTCGCTVPGRSGENGVPAFAALAMTCWLFRRTFRLSSLRRTPT